MTRHGQYLQIGLKLRRQHRNHGSTVGTVHVLRATCLLPRAAHQQRLHDAGPESLARGSAGFVWTANSGVVSLQSATTNQTARHIFNGCQVYSRATVGYVKLQLRLCRHTISEVTLDKICETVIKESAIGMGTYRSNRLGYSYRVRPRHDFTGNKKEACVAKVMAVQQRK